MNVKTVLSAMVQYVQGPRSCADNHVRGAMLRPTRGRPLARMRPPGDPGQLNVHPLVPAGVRQRRVRAVDLKG